MYTARYRQVKLAIIFIFTSIQRYSAVAYPPIDGMDRVLKSSAGRTYPKQLCRKFYRTQVYTNHSKKSDRYE